MINTINDLYLWKMKPFIPATHYNYKYKYAYILYLNETK